jgi:mannose-6-phosphate isomerase-like protein (cupin superfamily)
LGPGSVVFVASNEEHGIRNAGSTPAQYFVIALGKDA